MKIKFNDLNRIHSVVEKNINKGLSKIVKESSFILGETLVEFEEKYSKFTNSKHTIGCANGTEAIELTLRALEIGKNDEVLLPANTFIATAIAVTRTGATPIFYDCDKFFLSDILLAPKCISPDSTFLIPESASNNSVCPLPVTPAKPKISPSRISKFTFLTLVTSRSSLTVRFSTLKTTSPVLTSDLLSLNNTLLPTIISASCSLFVFSVLV